MNKLYPILILVVILLCSAFSVYALDIPNPLAIDSISELINRVINFLFTISLALFPLLVLIGAIMRMTAGGKAEQIKKSNNIILWSAIGFAVLLLSKAILSIIKGTLLG